MSAYPEALRDTVERYLAELRFPSAAPQTAGLEEAMRYSLLAGGKRIRPVLTLATARAIGRDPVGVLPLAAAIELIHTYSLIHDDLPAMDDDDLRRGRPTCHVKFGEDVAILAGDGLYAEAFRHLLGEQAGEPKLVLAAAGELAAATGVDGMVGGQYLDVAGVGETPEELRRLHALKTGRLIGASVVCVLLLAGMDAAATAGVAALRRRAGRPLPDRRRHPRRHRHRRRAGQAGAAATSAWASGPTSATSASTARATWPASAMSPHAPRCERPLRRARPSSSRSPTSSSPAPRSL